MRPARRRHRHVRLARMRETSSNQKATPCPSLEASTRRFTAWSSDGAWPPCWVPPAGTRSAPACPAPLARRSWPRSEGEGHSTGAGHLPPARGVRGRGGMVAAAGRSRASEPVPGPARMRRPDRQRQPCCPHDGLQKMALVSGAVAAACGEATCSRDSHLLPFTPPALSTSAPSSCDKPPRLQHTRWLPVPTPVRVSGPPHVVNNPITDRAERTEMVHTFIPNEPWLP